MGRILFCATVVSVAAVAGAAQQSSPDQRIAGCLQRAPAGLEKQGKFVLMNASTSPLGGSAADELQPAEPTRGAAEPIERRPGQSDARQETGGVTFLLQGGTDLEAKLGQRVEVTGTIGPEVHARPTRPTTARPMPTVQVKQVRALGATCHAPQP
jgi:hypothetical protein